jgi:hypothetical protein
VSRKAKFATDQSGTDFRFLLKNSGEDCLGVGEGRPLNVFKAIDIACA